MWQPETIPWDEYDRLIREKLKPARYTHSINVMNRAVELAETFGADPVRARLAGLLHDVMKNVPSKEMLQFIKDSGISYCMPTCARRSSGTRSQAPLIWSGCLESTTGTF